MASDKVNTLLAESDHDDTQDYSMTDDVKAILAKQLIKQNISVPSSPSIVLSKIIL